MPDPLIRPARTDEHEEIAASGWRAGSRPGSRTPVSSCWRNRARMALEVEKGWSLFVADDNGRLAAMLALHLPFLYLDQLFVAPEYQGRSLGRTLLAFTRQQLP